MSPTNTLPDITTTIVKTVVLLMLVLYTIFSFILISQIKNMRQTVKTKLGATLERISWIHFLISVGIIVLAFIIL